MPNAKKVMTAFSIMACWHSKHVSADFHQCVIYDSDDPNAKLIGIEYIASEKVDSHLIWFVIIRVDFQSQLFDSLPEDEKKYWHSHKYETKDTMPATDLAEQPAMLELQKTYGKTIHTWAIDIHPELPMGPPSLMMAYTGDGQMDSQMLNVRDKKYGMDTQKKRELRKQYLPPYEKHRGADAWEQSGKAVAFKAVEEDLN
ncbi:hypothetical protein EWM64_g9400 [Hericium alpestre]|uniref:DUF1264 domain-containing protein n=1 Tax=Hericium alpestre TaxID=135208 RepID=A0A4Y9ZJI7_9AGAM|nr:hypothetical protein EWM64_g9400 [Hericium alpestre]